jgi:hypothetical protein
MAQHGPSTPAQSQPLGPTGGAIRQQPLDAGRVSGSVEIPQPAGEAQVTVRSLEPSSVVGQYRIRFSDLDVNGDGFISREEAQANPALADEFNSLDRRHRGKLDRTDLAGWLVDWGTEGIKSHVHIRLNPSVPCFRRRRRASRTPAPAAAICRRSPARGRGPGSGAFRRWRTGG